MSPSNSWSKKTMLAAATAASVFSPAEAMTRVHRPAGMDRVLLPAVHWDMDRANLDGLVPQTKGPMYFATHEGMQDKRIGHTYAHVDAEWEAPTVVLEHSKYVSNVTCTDDGMLIHINHDKAFERAQSSWAHAGDKGLGLVSYFPGCGKTRADTRSFWKTKSFAFVKEPVGGAIMVQARERDFKSSISGGHLKWGQYNPPTGLDKRFGDITGSHTFDLSASPDNSANSPWGPAVLITGDGTCDPGTGGSSPPGGGSPPGSTPSPTPNARRSLGSSRHQSSNAPAKRDGTCLDLYCVGCGSSGSLTVAGDANLISFNPSVSITFSGNVDATVQLGLVANQEISHTFGVDIFQIGIPGFSVPEIFTIGPQIDLAANLDLTLHAAGELEAGATLSVPPFSTTFGTDASSDPNNQGFSPSLSATPFNAAGEIGLTATFSTPLSIGVGLEIPALDINKTAAIIETPSLSIDGTYNDGTCAGAVDVSVSVGDTIDLNIFDIKTFNLYTAPSPQLFQSCVNV